MLHVHAAAVAVLFRAAVAILSQSLPQSEEELYDERLSTIGGAFWSAVVSVACAAAGTWAACQGVFKGFAVQELVY